MIAHINDYIALLFVIFVSWITGFLFLSVFGLRKYAFNIYSKLSIDFSVGNGVVTIVLFLISVIVGYFNFYILYLFIGLLFLIYVTKYIWYKPEEKQQVLNKELSFPPFYKVLSFIVSSVIVILTLRYFYGHSSLSWDARYIYFFKSKMFFLENKVSPSFLLNKEYGFSHPDYPLLISLQASYLYSLFGHINIGLARLLVLIYYIAILMFVYGYFKDKQPWYLAILIVIAILTQRGMRYEAYTGLAEIPLMLYFMFGTVFYYFYLQNDEPHYLILSGIVLGIGAWTKNEGMAYFISVLISVAVGTIFYLKKDILVTSKNVLIYLCSGIFFIFPWWLFKYEHHILSSWVFLGKLSLHINSLRLRTILLTVGKEIILDEPALIITILVIVFVLFTKIKNGYKMLISLYLPFAIQFIMYILVYYIQPNPIIWKLNTSCSRIVLQIIPSILVTGLLVLFHLNPNVNYE